MSAHFRLPTPDFRLNVRLRLTLWYVAMLTMALLIFGGIVYAWQSSRIQAQLRSDIEVLQRQAGQFPGGMPESGAIAVVGPKGDKGAPSLTVSGEVGGATVVSAIGPAPHSGNLAFSGEADITLVVGPNGEIMQSSGPIGSGDLQRILTHADPSEIGAGGVAFPLPQGGDNATRLPADYQFYAQHIVVGEGGPGTLILGRPSAAVGELNRLMVTLLGAGVVALLAVAAGGYWLAGHAMRPVQAITRAAREIGETDLSRRLNLPNRDELGELAATFDTMLGRLDEAFRRQRQFTNDASHELRTPLTVVELELDRAMAQPGLPPKHLETLAAVRAEGAYMARLVNDLLTLARAEAGQAPLNPQSLDLGDLVLEVVERLLPLARRQGIEIAVGDLTLLPVFGDPLYLTQMLSNLVENAIKYSSGHTCHVTIDGGRSEVGRQRRVWVRVADTGPGIPAEHLPYLFDRFYRVDQMRSEQDDAANGTLRGSGLGLSIVRWAARAHGGDVRVESEVGRGSVFEVWIPSHPTP
jgi:signal transduction histidine kinase